LINTTKETAKTGFAIIGFVSTIYLGAKLIYYLFGVRYDPWKQLEEVSFGVLRRPNVAKSD